MVDQHLRLVINISALVVALDQVLKYFIQLYQPNLGGDFLRIQFITNTGAGFGVLKNSTTILTLISFIVALALIYYYKKIPKENTVQIFYALFLGGVIGNLIDRLFLGYVVDFISFSFWPAFNIADAAITIGVVGIIIKTWKK
ncbi:MAG TPA: signal peptidase II [Candidatus Nanoarchaeia archaeon]|nr:signal peptidase II [Candidatus Nanoarchaeia archaeon]